MGSSADDLTAPQQSRVADPDTYQVKLWVWDDELVATRRALREQARGAAMDHGPGDRGRRCQRRPA